jgi:hypothetical protein
MQERQNAFINLPTPVPATNAERSSAMLQEAARGGFPVMIPGGFEKGAWRRTVPAVAAIAESAASRAPAAADDRGRLEHELEGGGAPSQRRP